MTIPLRDEKPSAFVDAVARRAFSTLRRLTPVLDFVPRDKTSPLTVVEPPEPGEKFDPVHAYVLHDRFPKGVAVPLHTIVDVSFPIGRDSWRKPLSEFLDAYVPPAVEALSQKITRDIMAFSEDFTRPTVFAFGELPEVEVRPSKVITCFGLSVRARTEYDIRRKQTVVSIDMIYGLRNPHEPAAAR